MLILQNISYIHPNKNLLFSNINLTVNNHDKIALIGNNGSGKKLPFLGSFPIALLLKDTLLFKILS